MAFIRHLFNRLRGRIRSFTAVQFLIAVFAKFRQVQGVQTAASLSFTTLLSLVPLITVIILVTSQLDAFSEISNEARNFLIKNLLPDRAGRVITTYAMQFSQKASRLTLLGTAMLVVTAFMLLQTIDRTLNAIWEIRRPRRWYVRLPTYWIVLTLGPLAFGLGVFLTAEIVSASLDALNESRSVRSAVYMVASGALLSALFAYLFHTVPARKLRLAHSIAGGLVAGIGAVLVQRLFGLYLARLPNLTLVYGTFSVLPLFLIWLHATWTVVLLGASVSATLPDFITRRRMLPDTPMGHFQASVYLLRALTDAQEAGRTSTLEALAVASRQTQSATESMLLKLAEASIATRTGSGDWLLCAHGHQVTLGQLVNVLLLELDENAERNALAKELKAGLSRPVVKLEITG